MPAAGTEASAARAAPRSGEGAGPTRVRLFNVKYSPNLGDGLLSECLERALVEHGAAADGTRSVDLSAREGYRPGPASRSALLAVLDSLPDRPRRLAVTLPLAVLMRRRWEPHYRRHLAGADAVVVGGGNLLSDMDLNFPTKVSRALALAAEAGLPSAIYGVGVAADWSPRGLAMMRRALARARPVDVSVRDAPSAERFDALFAEAAGRRARLVRDPGLLAARYFAGAPAPGAHAPIGICITSATAVSYHSDRKIAAEDLAAWYAGLCRALAPSGRPILAFTNGSPEDEAFLDRAVPALEAAAANGLERRRPADPAQLAAIVSGLAALVAHRMHALVAAFAFGRPIHALSWDRKVDAFMASVGAADRLHATDEAGLAAVAARVLADAGPGAAPPDARWREAVETEAFDGVGSLAERLGIATCASVRV